MNLGGAVRLNKFGLFIVACLVFVFALHLFSSTGKNPEKNKISLRTLLSVAIKAAENGGKKVVENKDDMKIKSKGLTKEGLQDSLTNADLLSHCSMTSTIKYYFPSIKLISEETVKDCKKDTLDITTSEFVPKDREQLVNEADVTVWIDPLDATHEYTEKLYQYVTTMVCVAVKGKPVMGIIHKPFEKKEGTSWVWVGTAKSEDLNQQEQKTQNKNLKVIVSRSHKGNIEKVLQKNFDKNVEMISAAGAGYKVLEVAKNHVDAYLHITAIKKWDICAGNAVLNALGGKMLNNLGEELDYSNDMNVVNENGLIASLNNYEDFVGKLNLNK